MSIEIAREEYNSLLEASYHDPRYVYVSHWAEGERVREVLRRNFGAREAKNTFRTTPGHFGNGPVTIFFPGTLVPADIIFQKQFPVIEGIGSMPVLVDYPHKRFSQKMLRAQIIDIINSPLAEGREVNLVGFSLGAANVLDLLIEEPEARERIDRVVLMGALFSSHDFKDDPIYNAVKILRRYGVVRESTIRAFMRFFRNRVKVDHDPLLLSQEGAISDSIRDVGNRALSERVSSVLTRMQIESHGNITDIPALLIHWKNDESEVPRQEAIAGAFSQPETALISGNHGWTLMSAPEINPLIVSFLVSGQEALKAA